MLIQIPASKRGHRCDCCKTAIATHKYTAGIFIQLVCEECIHRYWWKFGENAVVSEDAKSVWLRKPGMSCSSSDKIYRCCKVCGKRWEDCSCRR